MTPHTIDGLLVVDKPAGMTSHDVVARIRKLTGIRRIGHTGTLDPMATGVLLLCIGKATRLVPFIEEAGGCDAKEYEALVRFGFETTTDDVEGEPRTPITDTANLNSGIVEAALSKFTGDFLQTPPAFSAKKVDGERAYARARRGEEVDLKPVRVHVTTAELLGFEDATARIRYVCSRGTYVRGLARDLGREAHTGAHLTALRRTRTGSATLQDATTLDALTASSVVQAVRPMREALPNWPLITVDERETVELRQGRAIADATDFMGPGVQVRICGVAGPLVALARSGDGRLRPFCVF